MSDFEKNNNYNEGFLINTEVAEDFEEETSEKPKNTLGQEILEWLDVLVYAMIAVIVIFCFVFRVATIDGDSMLNTLVENDKVIITNFGYTPKQGDIVVISRNAENSAESETVGQEPIIKRVIAVGGQTVDIDFNTGVVYIDGIPLEEDYLGSPTLVQYDVQFPLYIPEGHVFVLGDNRMESLDSRSSRIGEGGIIDNRYILGHAIFRFFPFNKIGALN